jgi:hypothetical protein
MTRLDFALGLSVTCLFAVLSGCGRDAEQAPVAQREKRASASGVEWIDPKTLQPGPLQRASLTKEQEKRIRKVRAVLVEVDPSSEAKWFDDFKRDLDPDREIGIWERIAHAYKSYSANRTLSLETKKDLFRILLL